MQTINGKQELTKMHDDTHCDYMTNLDIDVFAVKMEFKPVKIIVPNDHVCTCGHCHERPKDGEIAAVLTINDTKILLAPAQIRELWVQIIQQMGKAHAIDQRMSAACNMLDNAFKEAK
jgi:hypothetical protein